MRNLSNAKVIGLYLAHCTDPKAENDGRLYARSKDLNVVDDLLWASNGSEWPVWRVLSTLYTTGTITLREPDHKVAKGLMSQARALGLDVIEDFGEEDATEADDDDPYCVCGVAKSEHQLCGCGEWETAS